MSWPSIQTRPSVGDSNPESMRSKRGLAAAGATEEGKQFALVNVEAHIVDGYEVTEFLGDVFNPDERLGFRVFPGLAGILCAHYASPKNSARQGAGLLWCQDGEPVLMVLQALVRARSRSELIDFWVHSRFFSSASG